MIMITGGTGALARLAVDELAPRRDLVVGSRSPQDVAAGVAARTLDFDDPATMPAAFAGVDTLVLVSAGYAEDDVVLARHGAAIDAAATAGVRHVLYTSLFGAGDGLSLAVAHRWTERALAAAPFDVTVLRNGLYAQVPASLAGPGSSPGVFAAPWGRGRLSAVSRADLAEVLATVAAEVDDALLAGTRSRHAGRAYELVHPEPVGGEEVAAALAAAAGRPVRYAPTPLADAHAALVASAAPAYQAAHSASILSNVVAGTLVQDATDLPALLGAPPRPVLPELLDALGHPALVRA